MHESVISKQWEAFQICISWEKIMRLWNPVSFFFNVIYKIHVSCTGIKGLYLILINPILGEEISGFQYDIKILLRSTDDKISAASNP